MTHFSGSFLAERDDTLGASGVGDETEAMGQRGGRGGDSPPLGPNDSDSSSEDSGSDLDNMGVEPQQEGEAEFKPIEGGYDPKEYENLDVAGDVKDLFQYIVRYQPQQVEIEERLRPFIPDFIPAVGDIDAFLKVPRPDGKESSLGLTVLDEPIYQQSDPTVIQMQLRHQSKQVLGGATEVSSVPDAEKHPKKMKQKEGKVARVQESESVGEQVSSVLRE